jgi:hypothetical protein
MKGLNSSSAIFLGRPHWWQLELGADDDHRAARVVDTLAEQVLAEAALLALEGVGERLERAVVEPLQHPAAAAVVEQGVDRLLQHALLVAHDDVGSAQLEQLLQPVVAVDDAAVEVVQGPDVAKPAAVERHQGAQLGRDDRDDVEDHPLRAVAALAEGVDDLQPLRRLEPADLRVVGLHDDAQLFGELVDVDARQQLLDRLGAHARLEGAVAVLVAQLAVSAPRPPARARELGVTRVDDDVALEVEDALEVTAERGRAGARCGLGSPLKNQTCDTGAASSMWPMRSRRTASGSPRRRTCRTPTPRCFMRLYLPQRHSQSVMGPKILAQKRPSRSGLKVR